MSNPWQVVEDFEAALRGYCGAPYAVALSSATAGLLLAFKHCYRYGMRREANVKVPARTYVSVPITVLQAGYRLDWDYSEWCGIYQFDPLPVQDCALRLTAGMYEPGQIQVISFAAAKILGMEQGGALLHDNRDADMWFRKMRYDGRTPGLAVQDDDIDVLGYHFPMIPSVAAQGLLRLHHLPKTNPDQVRVYADISKKKAFQ